MKYKIKFKANDADLQGALKLRIEEFMKSQDYRLADYERGEAVDWNDGSDEFFMTFIKGVKTDGKIHFHVDMDSKLVSKHEFRFKSYGEEYVELTYEELKFFDGIGYDLDLVMTEGPDLHQSIEDWFNME